VVIVHNAVGGRWLKKSYMNIGVSTVLIFDRSVSMFCNSWNDRTVAKLEFVAINLPLAFFSTTLVIQVVACVCICISGQYF